MQSPSYRRSRLTRPNNFPIIVMLILAALALAGPLYSSRAKSKRATAKGVGGHVINKPAAKAASRSLLTFGLPMQETIATYASDCTTPKSIFALGETVCAITDNVDLNYPGGRWVDWILTGSPNTIESGSRTTTLITQNPQTFTYVPTSTGTYKVEITQDLNGQDDPQTPAVFTVSLGPESINTFESTCNTAQDNFTLVAGSVTVCAKADPNFSGDRFIYWVNSQGDAIQTDVVTSTNASATATITAAGNYWVYFSDADGSLRSKHAFTVSDPGAPLVDVAVSKNLITTTEIVAGGFITFEVLVTNRGPDTASTVELTDAVPAHVTYVSSTQDSGPTFTKTADTPTTTWSISSLPAESTASFTFTYQVDGAAAVGTQIANTANVSSTTTDSQPADNTNTVTGSVVSGAPAAECNLDCPNDIVTTATVHGAGGGANVTFATAEGFGTCGQITSNPASGSFFPIGTTTVVVTSATGGGGCSFTVTVIDSAAPTISCPANTGAQANSGQTSAYVPDPNGSSSNIGTATATGTNVLVTGSRDDGEPLTGTYPIGTTVVTWTATEYNGDPQNPSSQPTGRIASCQQTITVTSTDTPTITCPSNKTFNATNGCSYTATGAEIGTPTTTGPNVTVTSERSDGLALTDPFPRGVTFIEWTATNNVGSASCTQSITVIGNATTPPTLNVPPNVTVSTSSCGQIVGESELGTASASDDCGSVNVQRTGVPPGNFFPTGTTTITYSATNSAGTTTGTQTVTVLEDPNISPTIDAPANLTVNTGPDAAFCGTFVGDATLGVATANDNCPGFVVTRTGVPAGNNFPVGTTTITYTVTDRVGNTAQDTQTVTVIDNTPPVVTPPGPVTLNTGPGATSCSVTVSDLNATLGIASATDNCPAPAGGFVINRSGVPAGNVFPVGTTTLTYSTVDANGNTGSAQQVVTVVDNTAPVISCPSNIVLEPTCPTGAIATFADATATDNCGVQSVVRTGGPASGSVFPIGTTTVTFTATDIYNNTASCSFTVTVKTPQQVLQDMISTINSYSNLSGTQKQGLISKLQAAIDAINQGKTNVACNKLSDFNNQVTSYINNGTLTAAQGNALLSSSNHVRNTIGCTNNPCT